MTQHNELKIHPKINFIQIINNNKMICWWAKPLKHLDFGFALYLKRFTIKPVFIAHKKNLIFFLVCFKTIYQGGYQGCKRCNVY